MSSSRNEDRQPKKKEACKEDRQGADVKKKKKRLTMNMYSKNDVIIKNDYIH